MSEEKDGHRRWRSYLPEKTRFFCGLMVLFLGIVWFGCRGTHSGERAGNLMPSVDSNVSITHDLGLKKINVSKAKFQKPINSNAEASIWSAQCLYNQSNGSTDAFDVCMNKKRPDGVFSAKLKSTRSDTVGNHHLRTTQWYQGLRVVGAEIIVHINNAGEIYRINGTYLPQLNIPVKPGIEKKAALAVGMERHRGKMSLKVEKKPVLVIYAKRLAYHFVISHQGEGGGQWHYFVDAASGDIIFRYNNLQTR